jgi:chromosome segregation ATPase
VILFTGLASGLLIVGFFALWVRSLQQENRGLSAAVEQRNRVINQLEEAEERLRVELGTAKAHLATTVGEVARLDHQIQDLGRGMDRLNEDIERFQQSYVQVREEREGLMQRVLDLEQERASLTKRLSSLDELRLAIREAIEVRREAQQAQRFFLSQAQREAEQHWLAGGNRGYIIRDGHPTIRRSTMWIRVHEPEPTPVPP